MALTATTQISTTTPSPSDLAHYISMTAASRARVVSELEISLNHVLSWYVYMVAFVLPFAVLFFFLTSPDRDLELHAMPVDDETEEEEDAEGTNTNTNTINEPGSRNVGVEVEDGPEDTSGSDSEPDLASEMHSDHDWDDSADDGSDEGHQPSPARSCHPQFDAWARDLIPGFMD